MDRTGSRSLRNNFSYLIFVTLIVLPRRGYFCDGANIFVFASYGEGSRFMAPASIAAELTNRGHNVTALISNAYSYRQDDELYKNISFEIFTHKVPLDVVKERQLRIPRAAFDKSTSWKFDFVRKINKIAAEHIEDCEAILDDKELVKRLLDREFDLAIIDQFWPCSMILAEHVARGHVAMMPTAWMNAIARLNGNPTIFAIVPEVNTGLSPQMTFRQRIKNFFHSFLVSFSKWAVNKLTPVMRKYDICPGYYPSDLYQRAQLVISNVDFAVDFPIATQPHIITVGGLTTRPSKSLSQELEEYVQSSGDDGIIIFSLGTYVTYMKEELIAVFANAFARLPQKVIWQFKGTPPAVVTKVPNIKTMEWLPQNDLLGHNKTRALMYQGGNNGLYEALYHAVPIVVIPLIGDQPDVAARVTSRGMGLKLDIKTITSEKIVDALNAVIHEKQYKETVQQLSAIFHDRPMRPVEKAAFWIEHVIKHGGEYMRSPIHDLTWYEYYLIDVAAFFLLVIVVLVVFIVYSCKFAFRCCKRVCVGKKAKTE
ncbi:UDP-glucuronosyltransferase 2C1-like [Lytechinus pictus]|uniref:UDP-glucuronosyltransferase 2C1-like n=1 Tax=Lytechinus pictus TaxID=7653 RepID=UPI0030B9FABA